VAAIIARIRFHIETKPMNTEEIAMMTLYRLVRLIEMHSNELASCLLDRVHNSEATPDYKLVPDEDLRNRVYEIYLHLGEWLMRKDELELEQRHLRIGARRAQQGVPFSQVAWAITLTKQNLWGFLKRQSEMERPIEAFGELELLQLLDNFFDRAVYYAAIGHEKARAEVEKELARATA